MTTEGEVLHGGDFQAKSVTSAMEKVRQGIHGIGRMLFTQCTEIIKPRDQPVPSSEPCRRRSEHFLHFQRR
jgi:histidine ammonia-lyase